MSPELPQFISFGEALIDFVRVERDTWRSAPGGGPWNVACAMASIGQASAFAGAIGSDPLSQPIWQQSLDAGLDLRFIQRRVEPPLLAMVHELDPVRYFFIGQDSADLHFQPEALPEGWQQAVRWAHFGSLALAREPLAQRLLQQARTLKALGCKISYDPNYRNPPMDAGYDAMFEHMCKLADVIKVSEEDLCGLLRCSDYRSALDQIRAWNPEATLMLTRGEHGASLFSGTEQHSARPPAIQVVDTVGAGDASLAGLLDSLIRQPQLTLDRHLRRAIAAGAAACEGLGFCPPRPARVDALERLIST